LAVTHRFLEKNVASDVERSGPKFFQRASGRCIHIIDPFKVSAEDAVQKASVMEALGAPFVLLGSTDYVDFESVMTTVVARIREKVSIPVVSHFPPLRSGGLPFVEGIDFVIMPAILTSENPQFMWKSLLETYRDFGAAEAQGQKVPQPILSAAFTFGDDHKSKQFMDTRGLTQTKSTAKKLTHYVNRLGFHFVYLYSRHLEIELDMVHVVRQNLNRDVMLFVGVRKRRCRLCHLRYCRRTERLA